MTSTFCLGLHGDPGEIVYMHGDHCGSYVAGCLYRSKLASKCCIWSVWNQPGDWIVFRY